MSLHQYIDNVSTRLVAGKAFRLPVGPDFPPQLVEDISRHLELTFIPEQVLEGNVCFANAEEVTPEYRTTFTSIDLLDYYYAVLHSPSHQEKYMEFLKIDLSRIPCTKDAVAFWRLVGLGGQLRSLHLLASPVLDRYLIRFPVDGDNGISKPHFVPYAIAERNDEPIFLSGKAAHEILIPSGTGRVYINDSQYFEGVPAFAWDFHIGRYQPAQKWLKDREGRQLELGDILHYQKVVAALSATERLMVEIDSVEIGE